MPTNAARPFGAPIGENFDPRNYAREFEQIIELSYGSGEDRDGAMMWGNSPFLTTGLHNEVMMETRLLGQAVKAANLREQPPIARFEKADAIFAGYDKYHIGYEYYDEEIEDELYGSTIGHVQDLGSLMAETEEDTYFSPYNNGETFASGWQKKPMFAKDLGIIGWNDIVISNIIENAGGPGYTAIKLIEQYGDNFLNEEGRPSPIRPVKIVTGRARAKEWSLYYDVANISPQYQTDAAKVKPSYALEVHGTQRLANPNDAIIFYDGWQNDMLEQSKFRGKSEMKNEKMPDRTIHKISGRWRFFFLHSRRVVLLRGAS
jgi:hypothetical protein